MSEARLFCLLLALGLAALAIGMLPGSTALPPGRLLAALFGGADPATQVIVWEIRLPRALAAYLVGAALGLSGAALQGLLRNPLADPGVLGVSASAALAATVTLYYGLAGGWAAPLAAVLGALAATGVLGLAAVRTQSVVTLILIGVGLSSFAAALMSLLLNLAPNPFSLFDMINWLLGTVANRSLADIGLALPFLAVGTAILFGSRRSLSVLTLGEEAAAGVGVDLSHARLAIVAGAGLATGAAVSLAGTIGFVGLVAPHLVRPLVGHDPGRTLAPAAALGGLLLVCADILVRLTPTENELKLGVVAALLGGPAFIWIAARRGGGDG
ncbi:MAG: iron ABC transporter permease [Hyphomonadaceae bacterium]|nr:iron ABC transporter permease [Hyphomonadaceae bacterium]